MKGIIYRLVQEDTGLQYIGSTVQPLEKRLQQHYNHCMTTGISSHLLLHKPCCIEVIEEVEVESLGHLRVLEGNYMRSMTCVNERIITKTYPTFNITPRNNRWRVRKNIQGKQKEKIFYTEEEAINYFNMLTIGEDVPIYQQV
jgi:hypothetical protein